MKLKIYALTVIALISICFLALTSGCTGVSGPPGKRSRGRFALLYCRFVCAFKLME